jgi:AraC family transcriptional regulator of adaptative response / DNA-3-methyladenine glycosylase II
VDADVCYRAMLSRDRRFDGVFFVGVTTTGVYCRPICPARTAGRDRCRFFARAAEAERDGFRACWRCRPELAPGLARVDAVPRLVASALARIDEGFLNERSASALAAQLGVSDRHLRRALLAEIGLGPVELAQSRRLALAKRLLQDTRLGVAEIAFASGFASVRRFNALFRARFGRSPSSLRTPTTVPDGITLRLDYRPPLAWDALLAFLAPRALPGVESVDPVAKVYRRGAITVAHAPDRPALIARVPAGTKDLMALVSRLRALFDLDAEPHVIDDVLGRDRRLAPLVAARPGLRVPGAFDGFEVAVRAILGQQVSVKAATTIGGRLVDKLGGPPTPAALASASVAKIGLPRARARSLTLLARAADAGKLDLSRGADPATAIEALQAIPGIGPWTANYVAMRALGWPDAFPARDLVVRRVLGDDPADAWRPWRAYGVLHLWSQS